MLKQAFFGLSVGKSRQHRAVVKFWRIVNKSVRGISAVERVENCGVEVEKLCRNLWKAV